MSTSDLDQRARIRGRYRKISGQRQPGVIVAIKESPVGPEIAAAIRQRRHGIKGDLSC